MRDHSHVQRRLLRSPPGRESASDPSPDPFRAETVTRALERSFRPEFRNRIDRIVVFRPFERAQMRALLDKELADALTRRGLRERPWAVELDDTAYEFLIDQGFSPALGARPLKRALERHLLARLAATIVEQRAPSGDQFLLVSSPGRERIEVTFVDPDADDSPEEPRARDRAHRRIGARSPFARARAAKRPQPHALPPRRAPPNSRGGARDQHRGSASKPGSLRWRSRTSGTTKGGSRRSPRSSTSIAWKPPSRPPTPVRTARPPDGERPRRPVARDRRPQALRARPGSGRPCRGRPLQTSSCVCVVSASRLSGSTRTFPPSSPTCMRRGRGGRGMRLERLVSYRRRACPCRQRSRLQHDPGRREAGLHVLEVDDGGDGKRVERQTAAVDVVAWEPRPTRAHEELLARARVALRRASHEPRSSTALSFAARSARPRHGARISDRPCRARVGRGLRSLLTRARREGRRRAPAPRRHPSAGLDGRPAPRAERPRSDRRSRWCHPWHLPLACEAGLPSPRSHAKRLRTVPERDRLRLTGLPVCEGENPAPTGDVGRLRDDLSP